MKTIKVNIEKELIEIPDYQDEVKFAKINRIGAISEPNEYNSTICEEERFRVIKVKDDSGITKKYLIKLDDRGIFNELLEIRKSTFESAVINRTELLEREIGFLKEDNRKYEKRIKYIKNLPWWKRLFNKF